MCLPANILGEAAGGGGDFNLLMIIIVKRVRRDASWAEKVHPRVCRRRRLNVTDVRPCLHKFIYIYIF
jgi:hypothetical protein